MKTAIEWFQNEYELLNIEQLVLDLSPKQFINKLTELFARTKEKEKEQILAAYNNGSQDMALEDKYKPLEYYNQTYNQNK